MHLNLMEDTKYELSALFEHGLENSTRFAARFDELSALYEQTGMTYASKKLGLLADKLRSSGFEVTIETTELFALLWEYIQLVIGRLQYYNAKEDMSKKETES